MNKAYYKRQKKPENEKHRKARVRLENVLKTNGWTILPIITVPLFTSVGRRDYIPDVYASKCGCYITAEIDGESHNDSGLFHSKEWKDEVRDQAFLNANIIVARFEIDELWGPYSMNPDEIRIEISRAIVNGIRHVGESDYNAIAKAVKRTSSAIVNTKLIQ